MKHAHAAHDPGNGPPRRGPAASRLGFSLMELVVSMAVISVLLVSLGSAIVVTSRAMPAPSSPGGGAEFKRAAALDQMCAELRCATAFTEIGATSVAFSVPDRDKDATEEKIRYAWTGVSGAPLTREYNGGAKVAVADDLASFALAYLKDKHTTSTTGTTTWDSGEVQLAAFSAWSGITPTQSTTALSTTTWAAEAFTINLVTLPADTTKLAITRVSLRMRKPAGGTQGATIGIYPPSAAGASTPGASPYGTPYSIPAANMATVLGWVDATFTDVVFGDYKTQDFVIVVKGIGAGSATIQYLNSALAPLDSPVYRYTTNSGSSWLPALLLNQSDAPFVVYGSYQREIQTTTSADTYTLNSVTISMRGAGSRAARLDAAVAALNQPSVTGP
jgi:prepilin-type N-terminal cleavage/methylation domain-containing protein